jgi:hypothetical protein
MCVAPLIVFAAGAAVPEAEVAAAEVAAAEVAAAEAVAAEAEVAAEAQPAVATAPAIRPRPVRRSSWCSRQGPFSGESHLVPRCAAWLVRN